MSRLDIVRAWKDEDYRNSLSAEDLAHLPEHPAGSIELSDTELVEVAGDGTAANFSLGCCSSSCISTCQNACVTLLLGTASCVATFLFTC